jgi:hypothetical protein
LSRRRLHERLKFHIFVPVLPRYRFLRALWRQELEGGQPRAAQLAKPRETTRLSKDKAIRRMESGSERKAAEAKALPRSSQRFRPGGKLDPEELQVGWGPLGILSFWQSVPSDFCLPSRGSSLDAVVLVR